MDLEKAKYLCSLPKNIGKHPELNEDITINVGRFGPYLKCANKSARLETIEDLFSIGLNRAITLISDAKPGRVSSSEIKNIGEHPEDKKPVRVMKGQYGPYIKYKSLNATIPEDKDPSEITMDEALILIEKRREYDKTKKKKKMKYVIIIFSCLIIGMNFAKAEESCKGILAQLKSECNIVNKGYKNLKKNLIKKIKQ